MTTQEKMEAVIEPSGPGRFRATLNSRNVGQFFVSEADARDGIKRAMRDWYGLVPSDPTGYYGDDRPMSVNEALRDGYGEPSDYELEPKP